VVFANHTRNGRKIILKQKELLRWRLNRRFLPIDLYIKFDIIKMDFKIEYYKDSSGNSPIEDFLIRLKRYNNPLAEQTLKGLEKLKNRAYHKEPLSKHIESGLWELRIRAETNILRILYTFAKGRIIILLHIFIKKQQKTPIGELENARKRLKEIRMREAD